MASKNRLPWGDCMLVVLAVMILEPLPILALVSAGWWLIPPLFYYTPLIYVGLMLVWAPVLFICILLRPKGSWGVPVVGAALGLIQLCVILWPVGPMVGQYFDLMNFGRDWGEISCSTRMVSEGDVSYACTVKPEFSSSSRVFFLEGAAYSPFVKINR